MDITPTPTPTITPTPTTATTTNTNTNTSPNTKSPEQDTETPTRIQHTKPLSVTNGVLKRHHPNHHHHHHRLSANPLVVTYKKCLKNHAATLGGYALDGCGEFMPSPNATHTDPTSLKCAACGCHRNFHRREPEDHSPPPPLTPTPTTNTTTTIEYQPHHRHHPPPPPPHRSPNSASPPPISSSYYPSAPHMLLALSGGTVSGLNDNAGMNVAVGSSPRKRFRTKFSQSQKERMYQFAERVGWKMQKRDEDMIQEFCNEVGVDKGVLKVWMHNNKNTFAKRGDANGSNSGIRSNNIVNDLENTHNRNNNNENNNNDNNNNNVSSNNNHNSSENMNHNHHNHHHHHHQHGHHFENDNVAHVGTNGSSSSS